MYASIFSTCILSLLCPTPAFSSTVGPPDVLTLNPENYTLPNSSPFLSHRPPAPYLWQVRETQHHYIKFTFFGSTIPDNEGYSFLYVLPFTTFPPHPLTITLTINLLRLHFITDLQTQIRTLGKSTRIPSHETISWNRYTLRLAMAGVPQAAQMLVWMRGVMGFMNHYGYVEAEMEFLTWVGKAKDRLDGTAKLEIVRAEAVE
ncbi:MAG: hypothetical protein Q9170_005095 [Blastenia crenularia]